MSAQVTTTPSATSAESFSVQAARPPAHTVAGDAAQATPRQAPAGAAATPGVTATAPAGAAGTPGATATAPAAAAAAPGATTSTPGATSTPGGGRAPATSSRTPVAPAARDGARAAHEGTRAAHQLRPIVTTVPPPSVSGESFSQELQTFAANWQPVVAILFFVALIFVFWRMLRVMPRVKPQRIKPTSGQSVTFEDIAGVDDAKGELQEIVEFLRDPKSFRALGAKVPKGILLHGPPGTGKTLLAKAVANESGAQFFAQSAASFVEMFAGLGAARIRRLFAIARKHEPAIIFIDELDAVGGRRGMDISGEKDQTLNQLLVEMDGFSSSGRVVVIAASNLLDKLDPALLRPGRFDRQVFVVPPDVNGRVGVLEVHTRDKPLQDVDLALVAQQTSGLTGADLANICNEAAIFATRRGAKAIGTVDFDSALERVIAGVQSKRVLGDHEKRVVAYHEAGHALCGELLPSVDRVHKISIVPRGRALGFTLNLPAEDRYLKTREELLDYMTVLMGGRVAEQVVFGAITTGASDDLKRVADISHSMVHDYAMGTAGVGRSPDGDVRLSEQTLRMRDEERQELIDEARRAAQKLIVAHRPQLDALANELLEHEVLERDGIERIMEGVPRMERAPGSGLRVVAAAALSPQGERHEPPAGPKPIPRPQATE